MLLRSVLFVFLTQITLQALTVDLQSAIEIALENNKNHSISEFELKTAEAKYEQAMSARYPQFSLKAVAMRQDEPTMFHITGASQFPTEIAQSFALASASALDEVNALGSGVNTHSNLIASLNAINSGTLPSMSIPFDINVKAMGRDLYSEQIDLLYPIYSGGKIEAGIKQASLNRLLVSEKMREGDAEIVFNVKKYYYTVILMKKLCDQSTKTLEYFQTVEGLTKALYEGGSTRVSRADYLRMVSIVNMFQSINHEMMTQSDLTKSALIYALGLPWNTAIEINDNEFEKKTLSTNMNTILEKTYESNVLIAQSNIASKILDAKIDLVRGDYLPTVVLTGNARHLGGDESGYINSENTNSWMVGIGMEWKLFDGFKTTSEEEEARFDRLILENKKTLLREGLALQIKSALLRIENGDKKTKNLYKAINASSESSKMMIEAYEEDMANLKDVMETLMMDFFIYNEYVKQQYDTFIAIAELEKVSFAHF